MSLTTNHDHARREHIRHLATEAAPSRPLWLRPRRQRRNATSLLAALGIIAVIAACSLVMLVLPVIAVA